MSFFNIFARKDINEGVRSFRESKNAILLDVRTREEYASGILRGAEIFRWTRSTKWIRL